jgi:hypothetical protein
VKSEKHGKRGDVLRHPRDGYFTVGIDSIKSALFADLSKDDPATAGFIAFPSNCEDRLFQELTSEHRIAVKRMGVVVFRWEKVLDRQSNEMLDAYVYLLLCDLSSQHRGNALARRRGLKLAPPLSGNPRAAVPRHRGLRAFPIGIAVVRHTAGVPAVKGVEFGPDTILCVRTDFVTGRALLEQRRALLDILRQRYSCR